MEYFTTLNSPVGQLTLSSDGEYITGLWLPNQKYFAATLEKNAIEKNLPIFEQTKEWLSIYFSGNNPPFTPPLSPKGSPFRLAVWKILSEIPYGEVTTYGEIAKKISAESHRIMSAQPVGGAVGHNPISIIIPCHRVIGANGSLTGFAGGIDKKMQLLRLEGNDMRHFFIPSKGTAL